MIQYIILTEKGKIISSEPELPISSEDLEYINNQYLGTLYEGLLTKMPNLVGCDIFPNQIDWNNDKVLHVVTQLN